MAKKEKKKDELQSGSKAEKATSSKKAKETTPKKKKTGSKSKAFEDNIIRDSETAKERGAKGGIKSGEVRRQKMNAREAVRYVLELAAKGQLKKNLKELGVEQEALTNMVALQARLFTLAMSGNLEAYQKLMKMAGYEPEENRKERESLNSERRRDLEVEAKVNALGGVDGANVSVNTTDEDGHNDVVIYMPQMLDEKECEMSEENEEASKTDESETPSE